MRLILYENYLNLTKIEGFENNPNIIFYKDWPYLVVEIEGGRNFKEKVNSLEKKIGINSIEVSQKNFLSLIYFSKGLDICIRDIEFMDEIEEEESEILENLIEERKNEEIIEFITEDSYYFEIESIVFTLGNGFDNFVGTTITINKRAIVEISNAKIEFLSKKNSQQTLEVLFGSWSPKKEEE